MDPVHFSDLKWMAKSPAHYRAALEADRDTSAMRLGRAVHAYVLGSVQPLVWAGDRRTKAWKEFKTANEGAEILTVDEHDSARRMADSVLRHPHAPQYLRGYREMTIDWTFLGRACRSTLDVLGKSFVTDLKTCTTSDPVKFGWQAQKMAYPAQLAFYQDAAVDSGLGQPDQAYIVAVESSAPYVVTVLRLTDRALEQGRRQIRLWFERLLACEQCDTWPGYVESIVDLDVPDDDIELTFGDALEAA